MAINFDNALGLHPEALMMREKRSEVLASNLANADTPGYKARDLDFKAVMEKSMSAGNTIEKTQPGHISPNDLLNGATMMFRQPHQASIDGNTVESHIEQARYAENSVQYQASLRFINGRFSGLMSAIRGE